MSLHPLHQDLLEYVASYRGEQASPGQHPAALVTEIFASDSDDHNTLHCQQLEGWYHDYAKLRNMTYLFKKPDSVVSKLKKWVLNYGVLPATPQPPKLTMW